MTDTKRMPLRKEYIEMMRAHVDEGGKLSHRNGADLLADVEHLQASCADLLTALKDTASRKHDMGCASLRARPGALDCDCHVAAALAAIAKAGG